jgi:rubrerythrin
MKTPEKLGTLDAAEAIARAYGDTETAHRLTELAAEVQEAEVGSAEDALAGPTPICSICGGSVEVTPRVRCQACGFVFSS